MSKVNKDRPTPPETRPTTDTKPKRGIKSFVLRAGRLTTGQQRALKELWPRFGIEVPDKPINLPDLFGRDAPVVMEIGFGNGDNLVDMAVADPQQNYLGVEVHEPGVGHCLLRIEATGADNVRIIRHDAVEVLRDWLPDNCLARINLFFPDPWHKKRHHKRRIVQADFVRLLAQKLQPGGIFHVATDWPDYAEHIAEIMAASSEFRALGVAPADRHITRFDTRGQKLGHNNWERAWCTRSKLPIDS